MEKIKEIKKRVARKVAEIVENNSIVGLGSGSTASFFIEFLGERVKNEKLSIIAVPTSLKSAEIAKKHGIKLSDFRRYDIIDIAIDGADEIDDSLNLLKGYGNAHVREKIVARAAKRFIVIADYRKLCRKISRAVPVEVLPFSLKFAERELKKIGASDVKLRKDKSERVVISDNGNFILLADFGIISDVKELEVKINAIPGVVDNGLFSSGDYNIEAFIGFEDSIRIYRKSGSKNIISSL